MPDLPLLTWVLVRRGARHRHSRRTFRLGQTLARLLGKLHPDYLTGLDYLVTEQPDRALDMFLKLMDANADTIETHFALGSLYRRRGEVERAIRIHQNLLAREALPREHREQALLALAQDYLRAGRARSRRRAVPAGERSAAAARQCARCAARRLRAPARLAAGAAAPIGNWRDVKAAPPRAGRRALSVRTRRRGDRARRYRAARGSLLREARAEASPFPRAAVLRAQIAERDGDRSWRCGCCGRRSAESPALLQEELPHLLQAGRAGRARDAVLGELAAQAAVARLRRTQAPGVRGLRGAIWRHAAPLRAPIEKVFAQDPTLQADVAVRAAEQLRARSAQEIGALLAHAEKYRCNECGFSGRSFYWHCPACHSWDSFEAYAIVKLR